MEYSGLGAPYPKYARLEANGCLESWNYRLPGSVGHSDTGHNRPLWTSPNARKTYYLLYYLFPIVIITTKPNPDVGGSCWDSSTAYSGILMHKVTLLRGEIKKNK